MGWPAGLAPATTWFTARFLGDFGSATAEDTRFERARLAAHCLANRPGQPYPAILRGRGQWSEVGGQGQKVAFSHLSPDLWPLTSSSMELARVELAAETLQESLVPVTVSPASGDTQN